MGKGLFTQGVSVLLERPASLDAIESALQGFDLRGRREAAKEWALGGPTLIVAWQPEKNGLVAVDIVDRPWPDHMGDAQGEPMVFMAWSMGNFGPFAYPSGLQRAAQQSWGWEAGRTVPQRHKAFVRIRSSYIFGRGKDARVAPADYEALPELEFVTKLAERLLGLPGALCYFNPNGEVLRDRAGLRESLEFGEANDLPPLDVWSNVRLFNIAEDAAWALMDTVGNAQLDIPDAEAIFSNGSYDCSQVDRFLRNVSLYLLGNGEVIKDGDTMDGPGAIRWQARSFDNGLCDPPRRVLRWLPMDGRRPPAEVTS